MPRVSRLVVDTLETPRQLPDEVGDEQFVVNDGSKARRVLDSSPTT
jgi:hypothetical protein